jgi:GT2 family glycosyltransferase
MVYIIIVNWNCWRDTIECLESVLRLNHDRFRVFVCDNASSDDSLDHIAEWAEGRILASCSNPTLSHLTSPPLQKPISSVRLSADEHIDIGKRPEKLFLMQNETNLGFAGGNNVGLRLALSTGDLEFAWLLNNDTVVDPEALNHLIRKMKQRPDVGICGSTLLDYYNPSQVQALGGSSFTEWSARTHKIGSGLQADKLPPADVVERQMDYVSGASMMVCHSFLAQVGLLNEEYFLYFEEIDWAKRALGRFHMTYSPESIVYHREGASIGTGPARNRSTLSEFYSTRNRILFTRKHNSFLLPLTCCAVLLSAMHRILLGNFTNCIAVLKGMIAGFWAQSRTSAQPAVRL